MKGQLTGKDPDAGKDWGQEEKGETEEEMVGWHHQPNGREFEQAPGDSEGQGSLVCCSPWGHRDSDMTERLNNNKTPFLILDISYVLTSETSDSFTVGGGVISYRWSHGAYCQPDLILLWPLQSHLVPAQGCVFCSFLKLKNRTLYLSFLYFAILLSWPKSSFGFFCAVIWKIRINFFWPTK